MFFCLAVQFRQFGQQFVGVSRFSGHISPRYVAGGCKAWSRFGHCGTLPAGTGLRYGSEEILIPREFVCQLDTDETGQFRTSNPICPILYQFESGSGIRSRLAGPRHANGPLNWHAQGGGFFSWRAALTRSPRDVSPTPPRRISPFLS